MRRNKLWLAFSMILWGLVLVGSIVIYQGLKDNTLHWPSISLNPTNFDVEVQTGTSEALTRISIDWIVGNVTVIGENRTNIEWKEMASGTLSEGQKATFNVSGDTLNIRSNIRSSFQFLFRRSVSSELILKVPEEMLDSLKIESTSGKVSIAYVSSKKMDLQATSGIVIVNHSVFEEAKLKMTSGKMDVDNTMIHEAVVEMTSGKVTMKAEVLQSLDFQMTSGVSEVHLLDPNLSQLEVRMTSGKMEFYLPEAADFQLITSKTSGSIRVSEDIVEDGSLYWTKNKANTYRLDMTSGSFTLRLQP